ncbi:GIY-YIG nuclease family protein [Candidatus Kaiserbacteria bacterium]|nr:GIY-YIG nuclease family protein [Candidatus Kaiserbacteria bacterium]
MYYVYILLCKNKSLYTGVAIDVQKRFEEHKAKKGAKYTRSFVPVRILYKESFSNRSDAQKREMQIKGWGRKEKLNLIKSVTSL